MVWSHFPKHVAKDRTVAWRIYRRYWVIIPFCPFEKIQELFPCYMKLPPVFVNNVPYTITLTYSHLLLRKTCPSQIIKFIFFQGNSLKSIFSYVSIFTLLWFLENVAIKDLREVVVADGRRATDSLAPRKISRGFSFHSLLLMNPIVYMILSRSVSIIPISNNIIVILVENS